MKRFFSLLTVLMMIASFACAQEAQPQTVFTASASAPVVCEADGAVITFEVTADAETLAEAETKAASAVDGLKYALINAGAEAADIKSERRDVQIDREYHYNKLQEPQLVIIGRSVRYAVTLNVKDVSKLNTLLDAAVTSGLYSEYAVEKTFSGCKEARDEALALAAKDAVEKAETLARACGFAKTSILSVKELSSENSLSVQVEATLAAQK